jgi:multicomponent Na+:H+ antiporter subunit D
VSGESSIAIVLAAPLLSACLTAFLPRPPGLRDVIHIGFAAATAVASGFVISGILHHEGARLALTHPLPGVDLAFAAEPHGALFATIIAGLGSLHAIHTVGFVRASRDESPARLMAFISLSSSAAIAVALSANLFTLFLSYQVLVLASAPLIQDRGSKEESRAARLFLGTQLGAAIGLFLPAVVWTYSLAGDVEFHPGGALNGLVDPLPASILLVLFVMGASMAVVPPLGAWINAASGSRWPALASIQSLSIAPAGAITLLKIVAYVFGIEALGEARLAAYGLLGLCGVGACVAALIAIAKQDLRERLAYSCTAQILSAIVGALLASAAGLFASALQLAAACCAGVTLIMASATVAAVTGRTNADDFVGLGRVMPWTLSGFAVAAASMIGMPPFAGAWAKLWLVAAAARAGAPWAAALVGLASILTFAHLGPLAANAIAGKAPTDAFRRPDGASIFLAAPVLIGAAATLSLLVLADPLANFLAPVWTPAR